MTLLETAHDELIHAADPYESSAAYHADFDWLSNSMKEVFRRSPRLYRAYVTRTMERPEPTEAMELGKALHCAILEPHKAADVYCVAPKGLERRTKAGKEASEQFEEENKDKEVKLTWEMGEKLEGMRAAVLEHPAIRASGLITDPGQVERSIRWTCQETGIKCKCRPDKYWSSGVVMDLKTTSDPSPDGFKRAVGNLGYFRQAAFYLEGLGQGLGIFGAQFLFIAVGKESPFDCGVYELDRDAIDIGREQNAAILKQMKACQDSGDWRAEWEKDVQTVKVPRWMLYAAEQEQTA